MSLFSLIKVSAAALVLDCSFMTTFMRNSVKKPLPEHKLWSSVIHSEMMSCKVHKSVNLNLIKLCPTSKLVKMKVLPSFVVVTESVKPVTLLNQPFSLMSLMT